SGTVGGMVGAVFKDWKVCCGSFDLLEDSNSVAQSIYKTWTVTNTGIVSSTIHVIELADNGQVKDSDFNNIDGGIITRGTQNEIIGNYFILCNFKCVTTTANSIVHANDCVAE